MHPNEAVLNDYVEGALEPRARGEVERHLESCAECRALADDLREIARTSASLDPREPPARAWTRIERAIRLDADSRRSTESTQTAQNNVVLRAQWVRPSRSWAGLAAAAAIVAATVVGMRYAPGRSTPPSNSATPGAEVASRSVEAELRAAEQHYDKAIKGLEEIANAEKGALDARTAATLQENLAVIDEAISESRAAVRVQPASEPAQQSLLESFKAKLALLEDTIALINQMRKGNEAGAARIGSGLRQQP